MGRVAAVLLELGPFARKDIQQLRGGHKVRFRRGEARRGWLEPFLRQGNRKSFTRPRSSPLTSTAAAWLASTALISVRLEYLGQMPLTSGPRTQLQEAQQRPLRSSFETSGFPTAVRKENRNKSEEPE